ncbi:MAG: type II toxin-antitoxin system Phd/YefM family antitoxin [Alphaproteobacteria bacterium]|nr:type II toxin-antitoxin system Phd/YefM family antitoxin [Alphaproteobacteria bacterium]
MPPLDLLDDILPISDFRANSAAVLEQVEETGRPVVLTQRGRSAAVLVDVASWQSLQDELEVLRGLVQSRQDAEQGRVLSQDEARQRLLSRYT